MTRRRPAEVRFYVDQDLLGLGKVLASLRPDVTHVGDPGATFYKRVRPPSPVPEGAKDTEWIPVVAQQGWVILSRDSAIQDSLSELSAVREHGAKMICLTGEAAENKWEQLEAVMRHWRRIEALHGRPGPWVSKLSKSGLREVDVEASLARLREGRRRRGSGA